MSKTVITLKMKSTNEMQMKTRKVWGFMPATKVFKSSKDYNRHLNKKMVERAARLDLD